MLDIDGPHLLDLLLLYIMDFQIIDAEEEDREEILLTCDHHLCVQVHHLSCDEVVGRASVDPRVSGCQVVKQQEQRVGELP